MPKDAPSPYTSAVPVAEESDDEIRIDAGEVTSLIQVTNDEADAFRDKALPILRSCLLMLDDVEQKDDEIAIYDEMAVAERDQMLDAEMSASGEGFASLEDKFAAEDRIAQVQEHIDDGTNYPVDPMPQPKSVQEMRLSLAEIAELCEKEVKGGSSSNLP
jgi:intracellular multiplication protein IcmO